MPGPSLSDLPVELLLDHLLPALPARDLLALGATNHQFSSLCYDEPFWKTKCKEDFNFSSSRTARTKGWRFIYKGLSNPKVFVWGSSDNGRLGRQPFRSGLRWTGATYPMQLSFPKNSRIIDIVAGGWSFHALDSLGRVYVWGTMDGEMFGLQSDGFSVPEKVAEKPLRLELPEPVRTVSCGRKHSMAFDARGQIWTFISWGRPFRLVTPALDNSSPDATPVQVECGWMYSAALTASGDVFVWWPFSTTVQVQFGTKMGEMDAAGNKRAHATEEDTIPCVTWDLHHNPHKAPPVPELPELTHKTRKLGEDEDVKLVKIAAMDGYLIALTNKGHVLKFGGLSDEITVHQAHWEYLPNFSESDKVRAHSAFCGGERAEGRKSDKLAPPEDVQITHITAHFLHFVAYTQEENSVVLRGTSDSTAEDEAEVIPALQYKSIISVGLGDYHSIALSADGRLYSWGAFQQGALGLGLPEELPVGAPGGYATKEQKDRALQGYRIQVPEVDVPTEVRFDRGLKKKKDRFCFAATAAGWHSGALVIDLDPEEDGVEDEADERDPTSQMPGHFVPQPSPSFPQHGPGQMPFIPFIPRGHAPFRVGFAGRGGLRGRGR